MCDGPLKSTLLHTNFHCKQLLITSLSEASVRKEVKVRTPETVDGHVCSPFQSYVL